MKTKFLTEGVHAVAIGALTLLFALSSHVNTVQAQTRCPVGQYLAKYSDRTGVTATKCENKPIDHDWGNGGPRVVAKPENCEKCDPAQKPLGPDNFQVEWTGRFQFDAGTYTFIAVADDGIRVWVDGAQIINEWQIQPATQFERTLGMTTGVHTIRVEYFEGAGAAVAKFWWKKR